MTRTQRNVAMHDLRQFYPKTCSDLSKNRQSRSNERKFRNENLPEMVRSKREFSCDLQSLRMKFHKKAVF